jgi:hypothetical protein
MQPMKTRTLLLTLTLVVAALWITQNAAAQSQALDRKGKTSVERVNELALQAKNGDEQSTRRLMGELYGMEGLGAAGDDTLAPVTDRVVKAELDFRAGKSKGIDEQNVVRTVNDLADKMGAPPYAHTSRYEVRKLRSRMIRSTPALVQTEDEKGNSGKAGSISSTLSPVEAFHVTAMMVRQKIFNPDFQQTDAETRANWKSSHQHPGQENPDTSRRDEMLGHIAGKLATTSPQELIRQGHDSLTTLGIQ